MKSNFSFGDIIPVNTAARTKPKGLIAAISEIEWYYTSEKGGSLIDEKFFVLDRKFEFFEVGFKGAFISGLISAALSPLAIGVVQKMIPIFGTSEPSAFDKSFVFLLAIGFSLGYALFIGSAGRFYTGRITKTMIRNLLGGAIVGSILKAVIAFLFFHFIYLVILKDAYILAVLRFIEKPLGSYSHNVLNKVYYWIVDFKPVFLTAAWFGVITTAIFVAVPLIIISVSVIKQKKEMAGRV